MLSGVCGRQKIRIDGGNNDNRLLIIYVTLVWVNLDPPFLSLTPRLRTLPPLSFPVSSLHWMAGRQIDDIIPLNTCTQQFHFLLQKTPIKNFQLFVVRWNGLILNAFIYRSHKLLNLWKNLLSADSQMPSSFRNALISVLKKTLANIHRIRKWWKVHMNHLLRLYLRILLSGLAVLAERINKLGPP